MRLIILVAVFVVLMFNSFGQSDTLSIHYLKEVEVEDKMHQAITGLDQISIDSSILSIFEGSAFAELSRRSGFQEFRAYGTNGLALPAIRGTGSAHTVLLWNGINLQSPLNGLADLSLLTINNTDQINIVKGGSTAQFGNGAIGGAIQVTNTSTYREGFSAFTSQELGSFSNYYSKYGLKYSNEKVSIRATYFQRSLDNDYSFTNLHALQRIKEVRKNAGLEQFGFNGQLEYRVNNENVVGGRVWTESNDFEIPSAVFSTPVNSSQLDKTNRYMTYWIMGKSDYSISFKAAYLNHLTYYENETNGLTSSSKFISLVDKLELERYPSGNNRLIVGLNHRHDRINTNSHADSPQRNTYSAYGSYLLSFQGIDIDLGARQEIFDQTASPFLPTIGFNYELGTFFFIKGSASRNYRMPTLNDLYWNGAGGEGNPDLLPESSFNVELGLLFDKSPIFSFRCTAYRYDVDDWIQWRPNASSNWMPNNIKNVISKGLDSRLEVKIIQSSTFNLKFKLSHLWSSVTNKEVSNLGNVKEVGNQLIYTPLHSGSIILTTDSKIIDGMVTWNYVGVQYTEGENLSMRSLAPYATLNISFSKNFTIAGNRFSFRGSLNNLLGEQYENRRGYPMYGRNFLIGLTTKFN